MTSIFDILEHWASVQPEKILFEFRDSRSITTERYTYKSFYERTQLLAAHLMQTPGLRRGDRVLLAYPPSLASITTLLACARAGLIAVPVAFPRATDDVAVRRLRSVGYDCRATALLSDAKHLRRLAELTTANGVTQPWRFINTDDFRCPLSPPPHYGHEEVLFLQYTSGATGSCRGVVVGHGNVIANAKATVDHVPIGVSWLPQHHDMGLIGYYLFPIVCGGSNYGFAPASFLRRPALWIRMLSEVGATYTSSPNFGYEYCLRDGKITEEELHGIDLSSVRVLMNASEPARPQTIERFHQRFARYGLRRAACTVAYGLAENTLNVAQGGQDVVHVNRRALDANRVEIVKPTEGCEAVMYASCGKPAPGVTVYIREVATGRVVEELAVGEICVGGASVTRGYWNNEEATRDLFCHLDHGECGPHILRTGDLGFMYRGELFVCGRIKDLIIVGGAKFFPEDIEAAIGASDSTVRPRGVCAFQTEDGCVVVLVEPMRTDDVHDPARLADTLRRSCGLVPDVLHIVDPGTISLTTSGKVSRADTCAAFASGAVRVLATHRNAPTTGAAAVDAGVDWRGALLQVFSEHGVAADDVPLAELAFDSLALTELQLDLEALLRRVGSSALAEALDASLLQRLSPRDLLSTLAPLDRASAEAASAAIAALTERRLSIDDSVAAQMREDCDRPLLSRSECRHIAGTKSGDAILLTGATGFFGPFLLEQLLRQTDAPILVLVRAPDAMLAMDRVEIALKSARVLTAELRHMVRGRVRPVCGDLSLPRWGLTAEQWRSLAYRVGDVFHNGACVNYVMTYEAMRSTNVEGTRTAVQMALDSGARALQLISSTFIFGWTVKGLLLESDSNADMRALDFGYAQSKWVAEQQAWAGRIHGLDVRIFRPSLISVSTKGAGDVNDVAIRMLAFMIRHGIAVDTPNQLSIVAADVIAHNIVGISQLDEVPSTAFHVTADRYYSMTELTTTISRDYGYVFTYLDIPHFIDELNRRCTPSDPVYPLLDFFNRSAAKIAAMQLKRYSSIAYQQARGRLQDPVTDPSLAQTVSYLMRYLLDNGLIEPVRAEAQHPGQH